MASCISISASSRVSAATQNAMTSANSSDNTGNIYGIVERKMINSIDLKYILVEHHNLYYIPVNMYF